MTYLRGIFEKTTLCFGEITNSVVGCEVLEYTLVKYLVNESASYK